MFHRRLTPKETDDLLKNIDKEQHLLYYTYLTVRREKSIHYGQFADDGKLLGVIAYLRGLPFHAFSYVFFWETVQIRPLLSHIRNDLGLRAGSVGSTLIHERDMPFFSSQLKLLPYAKEMLLMKHSDLSCLPPQDRRVIRLGPEHVPLIKRRMADLKAMAFIEDELRFPFCGVVENGDLIAVGGFHAFERGYVELGNIGTIESMRRKGWGRKISAELTRLGREISGDVYLYVQRDNLPAVRLYESLGYRLLSGLRMIEFLL